MSRHRHSFHEPGHAHELTFSCYHRFPFLRSDQTCTWLAESIHLARQNHSFELWAYVFMPDHVHLIVFPKNINADMGSILKAIKAPVARQAIQSMKEHSPHWLERITRRRGDKEERLFWQSGGGYDRNIANVRTLLSMIDYIHANPVRKDLVKRPTDWKWSSARPYAGLGTSPLTIDVIPPDWID